MTQLPLRSFVEGYLRGPLILLHSHSQETSDTKTNNAQAHRPHPRFDRSRHLPNPRFVPFFTFLFLVTLVKPFTCHNVADSCVFLSQPKESLGRTSAATKESAKRSSLSRQALRPSTLITSAAQTLLSLPTSRRVLWPLSPTPPPTTTALSEPETPSPSTSLSLTTMPPSPSGMVRFLFSLLTNYQTN